MADQQPVVDRCEQQVDRSLHVKTITDLTSDHPAVQDLGSDLPPGPVPVLAKILGQLRVRHRACSHRADRRRRRPGFGEQLDQGTHLLGQSLPGGQLRPVFDAGTGPLQQSVQQDRAG